MRFQAAEAIAMPLDEAILDYQVIGQAPRPRATGSMRVIVVAAREPMIVRFVDARPRRRATPEGIDLNAFALVRASSRPRTSAGARSGARLLPPRRA